MSKILFFTSSLAVVLALSASAQDSTRVKKDSVVDKQIAITPYYNQSSEQATTYMKVLDSPELFKPASGVPVLNVLRGQVPSLIMSPYFADARYAGIRNSLNRGYNTILFIDGMPFNNSISRYINLNTFDFSSIAVAGSANATAFIQGANSGSFILTSKSGEGLLSPTFTFNSCLTTNTPSSGATVIRDNEWFASHSLAYSQDFGAIDTRISYNVSSGIPQPGRNKPLAHNLKLNTGFNKGKFSGRLLLFGGYGDQNNQSQSNVSNNEKWAPYQANLSLKYAILPWLSVISQANVATHNFRRSIDNLTPAISLRKDISGDDRYIASLFLKASHPLGKRLYMTAFTGVQRTNQKSDLEHTEVENGFTTKDVVSSRLDQSQISQGISLTYLKFLTVEYSARWSKYKAEGNTIQSTESNKFLNYSYIGASLIFSRFWKPSFLDFGKIRFSYGNVSNPRDVYQTWESYPSQSPIVSVNKYLTRDSEGGLDLIFLQSRIKATVNYYSRREGFPSNTIMPGVSVSYPPDLKTSGWEGELAVKTVQKEQVKHVLNFQYSKRTKWYDEFLLDSPFSTWDYFSFLNLKNLQFSFLIQSVKTTSPYGQGFTKLRDVTIGYDLPKNLIRKMGLKALYTSVSGRNLRAFKLSGKDIEELIIVSGQKSISFNILGTF